VIQEGGRAETSFIRGAKETEAKREEWRSAIVEECDKKKKRDEKRVEVNKIRITFGRRRRRRLNNGQTADCHPTGGVLTSP
jgi:hypothetical protein